MTAMTTAAVLPGDSQAGFSVSAPNLKLVGTGIGTDEFELVLVNGNPKLLRIFGRLALQVYGRERGYEGVAKGQKYFLDSFDTSPNTMHFLVRHRKGIGRFVAGVRLIAARGDARNLPLTRELSDCRKMLLRKGCYSRKEVREFRLRIPREAREKLKKTVEVSRYQMSEVFCKRAGFVLQKQREDLNRLLIAGIMIMADLLDADDYLSLCDAALQRGLTYFNVDWGAFSKRVDYKGRPRILAGGSVAEIHPPIEKGQPLIERLVHSWK